MKKKTRTVSAKTRQRMSQAHKARYRKAHGVGAVELIQHVKAVSAELGGMNKLRELINAML